MPKRGKMIKTFRYRMVPNRAQAAALQMTLDLCRNLYNCALEQRKSQRISRFAQERQLVELKEGFPEYKTVHVHVLHNVIKQLDRAFQAFFRRCRSGERPGFPRFKAFDRFDSFGYSSVGYKLAGRYLQLSKIGAIKLRLSRPLPNSSKIKALTITRRGQHWYACLCVEYDPVPLPSCTVAVGLDMGIENFAALSDGSFIENPRIYEREQKRVRRAQRRVARRKRGSNRRRKAVSLLRKIHETITNRRTDFLHKHSTKIIRSNGLIAVEALNIKGLARGRLSKQVQDASWGRFLQLLAYKAAEAGRRLVAVDCSHTSQTCPECGAIKKKALSEREHRCDCGYVAHRDTAAARVILGRAGPSGANAGEVIPCVA